MKIKICGIRSKEDIMVASYEGADAVGFIIGVTHKTEDALSVEDVNRLVKYVPPFVTPVLVTHFTSPDAIAALAVATKIRTLQLQGGILPEDIARIRKKIWNVTIIKAIHVVSERSINIAKQYSEVADMILLDSVTEDRLGGTGITHDWSISARIVREVNIPVILAGGLTPDNVEEAIRVVNPYGVDVNTGVKGKNGGKDPEKVRSFIQNVKALNYKNYFNNIPLHLAN